MLEHITPLAAERLSHLAAKFIEAEIQFGELYFVVESNEAHECDRVREGEYERVTQVPWLGKSTPGRLVLSPLDERFSQARATFSALAEECWHWLPPQLRKAVENDVADRYFLPDGYVESWVWLIWRTKYFDLVEPLSQDGEDGPNLPPPQVDIPVFRASAELIQELHLGTSRPSLPKWLGSANQPYLLAEPTRQPQESAGTEGSNTDDLTRQLTPSVRRAYCCFELASQRVGRRLTDKEAYAWLREQEDLPDGDDISLPNFDSWSRQLRQARRILGQQKYSRRPGRSKGKSVVSRDEIDDL